ncbi:MAG: site-specific DNA-methyltransferase [candidate division KSB1 bacterium]|nr:site-specific DNA-methyltransferase [candidate division KSB1 bacterium]MDZ7302623.1 site-specific DNA-methyltransferase [candidate division KSB1 bacterium]MDZ7311537.1 site-specific DNA-methyltransferase [candidate division KSB1 bacterium]
MPKRSTSYKIDARKIHKKNGNHRKVTRYTHEHIKEPRTPETGHTPLLPANEQIVTLPMDNGWTDAIKVGKLENGNGHPVVLDMDPAVDPVLFWAGKRNKRDIPVLPLQRNEIVSESRIAQIIERAKEAAYEKSGKARQGHLFADLEKALRESEKGKRVEFYTHEEGWKNKLICGDSLQVMESLLHYEGLRGKVQMIYLDPPYGIKYNSNFQQRIDSTQNDEKDQADDVLTIKAFRDTWALGIHSYLSYLQERLYLCRELMTESGSVFVQISDENVHRVRNLLDEVFGAANFVSLITFRKTTGVQSTYVASVSDYLIWYAKDKQQGKFRNLFREKTIDENYRYVELVDGERRKLTEEEFDGRREIPADARVFRFDHLLSSGPSGQPQEFILEGKKYIPPAGNHWKTSVEGLKVLAAARRIVARGNTLNYIRYLQSRTRKSRTRRSTRN